ncbi:MAG: transcription termination/antitermination protein NusA [Chloroflexi bacterium]|nr:transcription termination/antitermination protein NusA [Chloroflexota bacterium]
MKNDFLVAITQLCSERSLPKEVVIQAVEQALVSAYKRNFGGGQDISATIEPTSGKVKIFAHKAIVDEVHDRRAEISLADAKTFDPMAQIGGTIQIEATPDDFGRIAAQTAKQVILQRIREAERDALYTSYAEREGEIVHGTVHNVDAQNITVSLGKIEAVLPRSEQIPTERYRHNQKIRAYISEVNKTSRGPQVILSRTHRNMLRRLFELEVPEIFNGLVEIKAIARESGSRSKIAVVARQDGIDPVGACVGQRGVRIQAIVNELNGEKIDVVEWSSDPGAFVANALSPAKVISVRLAEDANGDKVANVVVQDRQLSLAIGKEGQNARLAAKLTGWRIDIKSETQVAEAVVPAPPVELEEPAAVAPEEIVAEAVSKEAPVVAEQAAPVAAPEPQPVAAEEPASVEPAQAVAQAPAAPEAVAETKAPEAAAPTVVEPEAVAPPQAPAVAAPVEEIPEQTFEEAWEEFEAEAGDEELSAEELKKRKEDRRKRQMLVFDEKLGKVVAKRKRKAGRARDFLNDEEG